VRIRGRLLILAAVAAAVLALPAIAQARSLTVTDANVHQRLAPDASLLVTEDLTWKIEGTYEAAYRDIPLSRGDKLTDVQVSENGKPYAPGGATAYGSHDRPGVFGVTPIQGGARIVWHYNATDETRHWQVSYRVINAVTAYDDVLDVGYYVWGSQWDFKLPHLRADFTDPALDPSNPAYKVWVEPRSVEATINRGDGVASMTANDIQDHTPVVLRVTVPRTPGQGVSGAKVVAGAGLPKIEAQEKQLDDDFNKPWNKAKRFLGHNAVALALALLAIGIAVMSLLRFLALEHKVSTPKYLPEPPDDAPPALAYGLAHEGSDSTNTVLATMLDLTDRGFYETKTEAAKKEKLDLSVAKAAKRPSAEKLTDYEQKVLGFFDELIGEDTVVLSEMKDKIPQHSSTWRAKWEDMTGALDAADEGQLNWDRKLGKYQGLTLLGIAALGALIAICSSLVEHTLWLPVVICGLAFLIVAVLGGNSIKRLDRESRERQSKWAAFEKWTKDFPSLKDDPPATLGLWKKILVYGVAFGTAERMIKSGRIPAPVAAAAGTGWSYYYLSGNFASGDFSGSAFASGFSSQVAPESSSSGGGFSGGGGGGFSGGGGGGGW
jgi:uncharacterized membrane protein